MAGKAHKFMQITGKMRAVFGPAQKTSLDGPIVVRRDAAQLRREAELQQWTQVRGANGRSYLVERPDGR